MAAPTAEKTTGEEDERCSVHKGILKNEASVVQLLVLGDEGAVQSRARGSFEHRAQKLVTGRVESEILGVRDASRSRDCTWAFRVIEPTDMTSWSVVHRMGNTERCRREARFCSFLQLAMVVAPARATRFLLPHR